MFSGAAAAAGLLVRSTPGLAPSARQMETAVSLSAPALAKPRVAFDPGLLQRALAALDSHAAITHRDRIAIVDFSAPSSEARFHFLDVASGEVSRLPVAHGMGSDPGHTGILQSFSNISGSNASSEGAFMTGDYYVGQHGRSQRLLGLDATNNNAFDRAIVIHGAWYANSDMIRAHGKLGRSQGCFAVGESELTQVFDHLGKGRLLYAGKA